VRFPDEDAGEAGAGVLRAGVGPTDGGADGDATRDGDAAPDAGLAAAPPHPVTTLMATANRINPAVADAALDGDRAGRRPIRPGVATRTFQTVSSPLMPTI
jgi:hypothetical protein